MISKKNKKILKRLDEIEEAFKRREREKWSKAEIDAVLRRGEQSSDFYYIWEKLMRLWAIRVWLGKYEWFPKSHKDKIKEWEKELKYFL